VKAFAAARLTTLPLDGGTLVAALPVAGAARVVSAAPKLSLALGYDIDEALEEEIGLSG
jgi:hypothetical protein